MRPIPTDPLALQARVFSALADDLFDLGAGRSRRFQRLDALHEIAKTTREPALPKKRAGSNHEQP